MRKIDLILIFCLFSIISFGQGINCATSDPFCTGTTYNFPLATNNGSAEVGPAYTCLLTQPNPVWYYLLIDQPGNLDITIQSSPGTYDVDFSMWGPFSSLNNCGNLTAANTVDCSYSTSYIEYANISNALTGQYYILLITNYSNSVTDVTFSQTGGTGTTNCNIVYCNITGITATPGACVPASNTFTLTGCVNYNNTANDHPPTTGTLTVTVNPGGYTQTFSAPFAAGSSCFSIPNIPSTGGAYTVTGTFSDAPTCTWTSTFTAPGPCNACSVNAGVDQSVCGLAATLAATTTAGYSAYHWDPVAGITFGNINSATSTITASAPGTYTFTWWGTNSSSVTCSDQMTVTFTNPLSSFTYNGNHCQGLPYNFTNTGTSTGATYAWTFTGGTPATSTAQNPTGVTFSTAGAHTVTLVVTVGVCTATYTQNVTVYALPTVSVTPTNAACFGLCNGSAVAAGSGGSGTYTYSWSNGGNTANISSLCPGTYTVTVTDTYTCTGTGSGTISQPAALTLTPSSSNPTCNGLCNGTANIAVSGGLGPFAYAWSNLATTASISGLCANNYTVTVTDNAPGNPPGGCTQVANYVLTAPPSMVLSGSNVNATCGANNGSATVTVNSGGGPNYSYSWSNGSNTASTTSTTNTISGIGAGSYTVTVTSNSCSTTTVINVGSSGAPTATITSSSNPTCFGQCNGTATVSLGGTLNPNYNYSWSTGSTTTGTASTTNTASNLCNGTNSVTVTDNAGCIAVASVTVTQPAQLVATTTSVNAHCNQSDGSATVNAIGGTGSYTYQWGATAGSQTTQTATNLAPGTYSVTVRDVNSCSVIATVTVNNTAGVTASISAITNVSCFGGTNGSATATGTGGTGTPTYLWPATAGNQSTATATNLGVGTYIVTVTDGAGCTSIASATITQPAVVTATITGSTPALCNGVCNGTATVTAGGGTPGYTYSWSNAGTAPLTTGLCAGNTYIVTVRDANLCSATASVSVTQPTAVTASAVGVNANCGNSNGSATVTGLGGTTPPPYTYLWSAAAGSQITQTATNLAPGSYTVTVSDANSCTAVASVTVGNNPGGTASISNQVNVSCNGLCDGSATVSMGGGVAPFTYAWSSGSTLITASGLCAGPFSVTVTDANLCTSVASGTITQPALLAVNLTLNDVLCFGDCSGSIIATPSGGTSGYSYSWSNVYAGPNNTNLCAGPYTVTVTDTHGCTISGSQNISLIPAITLSAVPTSANCNQSNGALNLTVTNGAAPFTFLWTGTGGPYSTEDLTSIPAGTYSVTVADVKGCTAAGTFNVPNVSGPVASISSFTNVSCFGLCDGVATGSVSGGTAPYTYSWSNAQPSQTATNLCSGIYSFSVTDAMLCVSTATVTITEPSALTIVSITGTNPACNGDCNGTAVVLVNGGTVPYQYSWTGGAPFGGLTPANDTTAGLCSGVLTANITDANGCTVSNTVTITEPTFLSLTSSNTDESCSGQSNGSATVNASGGSPGYTYQWSANAGGQSTSTATGLTGGIYTVVVSDSHLCTETTSVTVNTPNPLVISNITPTNIPCNGLNNGSIGVNVSGGTPNYTFNWTALNNVSFSSSSQNISGLSADTYFLTVTDQNGCFVTSSAVINQPPPFSVTLNVTDETCYQFCNGSIQANPNGGQPTYSYLWSDLSSGNLIINKCPGTYSVTVTDNNNCTVSQSATITGPPLLVLTVDSIVPATCGVSNGEAFISVQGGTTGYSISWSTGGNSLHETNMPAGNQWVALSDNNGCSTTQQVPVQNLNGPQIIALTPTPVSCAGMNDGVAIVSYSPSSPPAPPYISTWSNSWVGDTASGLQGGLYYVTVIDANGCEAAGSIIVDEPTQFVSVPYGIANNLCNGNCNGTASVLTGGGTQPYNWNWLGIGQTGSSASNLCAGQYTVVATDAHGCTSVNVIDITEPTPISITGLVTNAHCNGDANGSIATSVTGGTPVYQFVWQAPLTGTNSTIGNLTDGTYSVLVTDINNCSMTSTFTVTEPTPILAYLSTTPSTCGLNNGTATLDSVTGGTSPYTYLWSPGNYITPNIGNLTSGLYQLQITDNNWCGGFVTVVVNSIAPPTQITFIDTNATCNGTNTGSATANAVGGLAPYTYLWSDLQNTQTASALSAGLYSVTITDANGCTISNSTQITQPNPITIFVNGADSICLNSYAVNITANASGGTSPYNYLWTGLGIVNPTSQTQQVSPPVSTNYYVNVFDAHGCAAVTPGVVPIYVYPVPYTNISADATICEGDFYDIQTTASGGSGAPYNYYWNIGTGNPNHVSPITTTTYTLYVTDACGTHSDTVSMTITVKQAPDLVRDPRFQKGCVEFLADFDCIASVSTGGINYEWDFGDPSSGSLNISNDTTPSHLYTIAGAYDITLTLTSDYGCDYTQTFNDLVIADPIPTADFYYTPTEGIDAFHGEVHFYAQTDPSNDVTWYFENGGNSASGIMDPVYLYTDSGTYDVLLVVSANGCIDTVHKTIKVNEVFTLWAPTAFYPGTGVGDGYFYPKGNGFDKNNYYLAIYDRWGQVVFETTTYPEATSMRPDDVRTKANANDSWLPGGWNGGKNNDINKLVPVGTYTWYCRVRAKDSGDLHEETGPVTVIR